MVNADHRVLAERLAPGWSIGVGPIWDRGEHFWWQRQIAIVDQDIEDQGRAIAHAAAHVALGHHVGAGESFTEDQEAWADCLIDILLGDASDWVEAS